MNFKAILILVVLTLGIMAASGYVSSFPTFIGHGVSAGEVYKIQRIEVMEGHVFDITFTNGKRIEGRLDVVTPPQASVNVIEVLNKSHNPLVHMLSREDYGWKVKIELSVDGNRIYLSNWLRQQGLVWDY